MVLLPLYSRNQTIFSKNHRLAIRLSDLPHSGIEHRTRGYISTVSVVRPVSDHSPLMLATAVSCTQHFFFILNLDWWISCQVHLMVANAETATVFMGGGTQPPHHKPCIVTPPSTPQHTPPQRANLMDNNGIYRAIASLSVFVPVSLCNVTSAHKDLTVSES